jgi:hypothetical protein
VRGVEQRPVVRLDHCNARAHDPRQFVNRHASRQSVGRECRPQVVDSRWLRDPGSFNPLLPVPPAEVVYVERTFPRPSEQVRAVQPSGERVDGRERLGRERNLPSRAQRLRSVLRTVRTRRVLSMSRRSTRAHSLGRGPVATAKVTAAAPRSSSSPQMRLISSGLNTRMSRGVGCGFLPASFAGFRVMCP